MSAKIRRRELRGFSERPTFIQRAIAAYSFAFLGAIFSAVSALLIVSLYGDRGFHYTASLGAINALPAWVFYGVSLAFLPLGARGRQALIVAITLITGLWISYAWQYSPFAMEISEIRGERLAPFDPFSRLTLIVVVSVSVGGFFLSKLTNRFEV